jgi:ribosome-binding protein aMBF1 (putative translation factor)
MIAKLLGTSDQAISRYLSGQLYPNVRMIKKLEAMLGWKAQAQLDLIPVVGHDHRYGMVLRQELEEWKQQNPRTVRAAGLKSLFPTKFGDDVPAFHRKSG